MDTDAVVVNFAILGNFRDRRLTYCADDIGLQRDDRFDKVMHI
jgi:hypothetical protein